VSEAIQGPLAISRSWIATALLAQRLAMTAPPWQLHEESR